MVISQKIHSSLKIIPGFISALVDRIKVLPLSEDDNFNVKLSLEEALSNAIRHGNKLDPDLFVEVCLNSDDGELTIEVKDLGNGFDFKNIPDPSQDPNLKKISGRGIFLIRKLMDKVEFFDSGRRIKMTKFLKKEV